MQVEAGLPADLALRISRKLNKMAAKVAWATALSGDGVRRRGKKLASGSSPRTKVSERAFITKASAASARRTSKGKTVIRMKG